MRLASFRQVGEGFVRAMSRIVGDKSKTTANSPDNKSRTARHHKVELLKMAALFFDPDLRTSPNWLLSPASKLRG